MSSQSNPAARNLICSCTSSCVWKTFRACCRSRPTVDSTRSSAVRRAPVRSYQLARATTAANPANEHIMNVRGERIVQNHPISAKASPSLLGRGIRTYNTTTPIRMSANSARHQVTQMQVGFAKAIPTYDALPGTGRSRIRQGEDSAGRRDPAQHVCTQRHQRRRGDLRGNRARDQHRPAERAAQPLQPAD